MGISAQEAKQLAEEAYESFKVICENIPTLQNTPVTAANICMLLKDLTISERFLVTDSWNKMIEYHAKERILTLHETLVMPEPRYGVVGRVIWMLIVMLAPTSIGYLLADGFGVGLGLVMMMLGFNALSDATEKSNLRFKNYNEHFVDALESGLYVSSWKLSKSGLFFLRDEMPWKYPSQGTRPTFRVLNNDAEKAFKNQSTHVC